MAMGEINLAKETAMANEADGPRTGQPDPEVIAKPMRRIFSAKYKLEVLSKADKLRAQPGELGKYLRREGLYSSQLSAWTRERDRGALAGLGKRRGRKPDPDAKLVQEHEKLKREYARLRERLKRAEAIIDLQKKASDLLGLTINNEGR